MILLTRFHSGERFAVNTDLIERIEETPDTVITLTNGTRFVVQESIDEIAEQIQNGQGDDPRLRHSHRRRILRDPTTTHLRVVHATMPHDSSEPPRRTTPIRPPRDAPPRQGER